jgi:hypothetical protein
VLNEGSYTGGLSDGGERLTLMAPDGSTVIRSFVFDDDFPWPDAADGAGPSLVLIAPETNPDHSLAANWRSSTTVGGNPGATDAVAFAGNPVADTDHDGFTDLGEYALGDFPVIIPVMTLDGLTFTVFRVPNADDAEILGQVSVNLTDWTAAAPVSSTPDSLTFRVPAALAAEKKVFLRASIRLR